MWPSGRQADCRQYVIVIQLLCMTQTWPQEVFTQRKKRCSQQHYKKSVRPIVGKKVLVPEHTAHEQQMLWDLCWVEQGGAVGAQAGQEGPGSPGAVLAGPAQPQPPQVGAGPLPETQGWNQLRGQGWLGLATTPLFDDDWRNCDTEAGGDGSLHTDVCVADSTVRDAVLVVSEVFRSCL